MEARERAVAIGILFVGVEHEKVITPETLEGTRQYILTAQREAIKHYKSQIAVYAGRNPTHCEICSELMDVGSATLIYYE